MRQPRNISPDSTSVRDLILRKHPFRKRIRTGASLSLRQDGEMGKERKAVNCNELVSFVNCIINEKIRI
ncbi:MAG: hypothetical protein NC097_05360 [Clostridium sp.]|nr:hypothetical protein [Prevotella sp.]MCM1429205.1 hypothetical protein [Clostridium sp.]